MAMPKPGFVMDQVEMPPGTPVNFCSDYFFRRTVKLFSRE